MTGLVEMASVPQWTTNSSGNRSDDLDRCRVSVSSWRREAVGDKHRPNSDSLVVNGMHMDNDQSASMQDYNSNNSSNNSEKSNNGIVVDSGNIVSVHDNPFFKHYGIKTFHRHESKNDDLSVIPDSSNLKSGNIEESEPVFDNSEEQEYHPGSGFVTKLLGKFSSLSATAREDHIHRPKRTASLEILDDHKHYSKGTKDDSVKHVQSGHLSTSSSVLSRSVENVNKPLKPLKVPVIPFKNSFVDVHEEKKKVKSPREHHEPADVKLGREDIIIIETTPTSPRYVHEHHAGKLSRAQSQEDTTNTDELPKPNTVLNVRSFFESKKKHAPPPIPPPFMTTSPTSTLKAPPLSLNRAGTTSQSITSTIETSSDKKTTGSQKTDSVPVPAAGLQKPQEQKNIPLSPSRYTKKPSPVVSVAPFKDEPETNSSKLIFTSKPIKPTVPKQKDVTSSFSENKEVVKKMQEETFSSKPREDESEILKVHTVSNNIAKEKQYSVTNNEKSNVSYERKVESEEPERNREENGPIKGIPTFIANRRKKEADKLGLAHQQNSVLSRSEHVNSSPVDDGSIRPFKTKLDDSKNDHSPVPKKRQAPPAPSSDSSTNSVSGLTNGLQNIRSSLRNTDSSQGKMVFDSSSVKKKPRSVSSSTAVPRLNLSSITDDHHNEPYMGKKQTEIKPCRIEFIGAMVKCDRSLLHKKRFNKGKITFSDQHNTTFEYPSEEWLLELYLAEHPEEREEMLMLEDLNTESNESTDDDFPETPRENSNSNDEVLRSNTSLSHSGGLGSYRTRNQADYQFGSFLNEPEAPKKVEPPPEVDPEELDLIPADEDDTVNWSSGATSDLLF